MRRTATGRAALTGLVLVVLGGLVSVLLVGCDHVVRRERTAPKTGQLTYVALGDSYTSGPGLGQNTGPIGCGQTSGNYPHQLARQLHLHLVDASCGGATTADIVGQQTLRSGVKVAPQIDSVTEDADVVTLSIGGNDARAFSILVSACVGLAQKDPQGSPCTTMAEQQRGVVDRVMAKLATQIAALIGQVRTRAPHARVVMVGYPEMFPAFAGCDRLPLARGDYPLAHRVMRQIVDAQERGAATAHAEYVDVWTASKGHDMCAEDPWIAGLTPTQAGIAYHPYEKEQQVVADLLAELLEKGRP